MNTAPTLKTRLAGDDLVMAPGAADALTARLIEGAGFPAVYLTGFGATASLTGCPDVGLLTQTEMITHARNMVRAVKVPVIADADTGYGGPANIERTVHEYLQAGVAAMHLEDQAAPKRCGHMAGLKLVPVEEMPGRMHGLEKLDWPAFLGREVRVLNDSHAALLGEEWLGSARGWQDVVMITLGTSVGGAILSGGQASHRPSRAWGSFGPPFHPGRWRARRISDAGEFGFLFGKPNPAPAHGGSLSQHARPRHRRPRR
jgi:hypothetical protein